MLRSQTVCASCDRRCGRYVEWDMSIYLVGSERCFGLVKCLMVDDNAMRTGLKDKDRRGERDEWRTELD